MRIMVVGHKVEGVRKGIWDVLYGEGEGLNG